MKDKTKGKKGSKILTDLIRELMESIYGIDLPRGRRNANTKLHQKTIDEK
jgi:hypothetical protein